MDDHSYRRNMVAGYGIEIQHNIHYHAVHWQYMVGLGLNQKWWKIWKKFPATYSIHTPQTYFTHHSKILLPYYIVNDIVKSYKIKVSVIS